MKTLIAVPCMDQVAAGFAQSLATLNKVGECVLSFHVGSLVYESRNKLARQALSICADYVMWFDSDIIIPQDTLEKMIKHMETKDIVTGVYYRRHPNYDPVLFSNFEIEDGNPKWEGYNRYPQDEMFEVAAAGFGCIMVKTSVLMDVFLNYNAWFDPIAHVGEDMSFSWRARQLGYKVWCDPSIQCGHTGTLTVTKELYEAMKHED